MSKTPAFDKETLCLLVSELGSEDTAEVLRAFLEDTANKIGEFRAAPVDPALVQHLAHSIKSSAGTFGFRELSGLALSIEQSALLLTPEQLEDATARLGQVFEETAEFARSVLLASNMEVA